MEWENVTICVGSHPVDRYIDHFLKSDYIEIKFSDKDRKKIRREIKHQIKSSFVLAPGQLKKLRIRREKKGERFYLGCIREQGGQLFVQRVYVVSIVKIEGFNNRYAVIVYTVLPPKRRRIKNLRGGSFAQKINTEQLK